jgi:transcriptional regulator of met regulon
MATLMLSCYAFLLQFGENFFPQDASLNKNRNKTAVKDATATRL